MFVGVHTALVTPFRDQEIDFPALDALVERQVLAGVNGIVPCGTTGEASTLSEDERLAVIRATIEKVAGRCQVIAGVGTNNTAQSIRLAQAAADLGADGALIITPYYNKPTQEGLYHHCRAVAETVPELPVVLYNVPGRTGISFDVNTIARLADLPGVVALKEATGDMNFNGQIVCETAGRLNLLSGDDPSALSQWAIGGQGVISVTSNLLPEAFVELWRAFSAGEMETARALHLKLLPMINGMFIEANPVPVKTLIALSTELCTAEVRLPLVPLEPGSLVTLRGLAETYGLDLPDAQ